MPSSTGIAPPRCHPPPDGGTLRHVNNSLPGPVSEGLVHGNGSRQPDNWLSALAEPFVTILAHGNGVRVSGVTEDRGQDVCPHRKLPVGLLLLLGRDARQGDVWDAGANEGMCGEVWRIHQQLNHEPISLCFLVVLVSTRLKGPSISGNPVHKAAEAGQTFQILIHPSESGG